MSITFTLYQPGEFTRAEIDLLWDEWVCMDDWDYLVMTTDFDAFTLEEKWCPETERTYTEVKPNSSQVEKLLTGCYRNIWYKIQWEGIPTIVGVAYHG